MELILVLDGAGIVSALIFLLHFIFLVQYSFIRKLKVTFLSNSAKACQVSLDTTIYKSISQIRSQGD